MKHIKHQFDAGPFAWGVILVALVVVLAGVSDAGLSCRASGQTTQPATQPAGVVVRLPSGGNLPTALANLPAGGTLLLERGGMYEDDRRLAVLPPGRDGVTIEAWGDPAKPEPRVASARGGLYASSVKRLTVRDIRFMPRPNGKGDGVILRDVSDVLLERVVVNEHAQGMTIQGVAGRNAGVTVRACRVYDNADPADGKGQGIYSSFTDGLVIRDSVIVRNGWMPAGASSIRVLSNVLSHDVYLNANNGPVVFEGNVVADAASHGAQIRCGGGVRGNVFLGNPIHLSVGLMNGTGAPTAGGVTCDVDGNVFVGGRSIEGPGGGSRGWGLEISNVREGRVVGNLFAHEQQGGVAIQLKPCNADDNSRAVGVIDLRIEDNAVWDWRGAPYTNTLVRGSTPGNRTFMSLTVQPSWAPPVKADLTRIVNLAAVRELLKRPPTQATAADLIERCHAAVEDPALVADMKRLAEITAELAAVAEAQATLDARRKELVLEQVAIRARHGLD